MLIALKLWNLPWNITIFAAMFLSIISLSIIILEMRLVIVTFTLILQISLCLITLGTVVPTVILGSKIPQADRPVFLGVSGLAVGVMFVAFSIISGPGFSSLWGIDAWISMVILMGLLLYINNCTKFSLRQAVRISFFMEVLLLSAIPMSNFSFYGINITDKIILYALLIPSFAFVIYNSSLLLLSQLSHKNLYSSAIYVYLVLLLLLGFKPFTKTYWYTKLMNEISYDSGFISFGLSLFIHLVVIPLAGIIPYFIIKGLSGPFKYKK